MFGMNEKVGRGYFKNIPDNQLVVTSRFFTIQGEGPFRGKPAFFIRLTKCNLSCSFCFVENTYIAMADGPKKKISEVEVGEEVLAYDEKSGEFKKARVTKVFESESSELIAVKTGSKENSKSKTTFCTPEHPFLVRGKGWVEAKDLQENDAIIHVSNSDLMKIKNPMCNETIRQNRNGEYVKSIEHLKMGSGKGSKGKTWVRLAGSKDKKCKVYNLEVENYHTYIADGKVVHNCDTFFDQGDPYTFEEIFDQATKEIEDFFKKKNMDVPHWADNKIGPRDIVLVLTGGEPSLQKNLSAFLDAAKKHFKYSQIESNGIILLDYPDPYLTYVVSPKCLEKDGQAVKYLSPNQKVLDRADCLKFVMGVPENDQFYPYSEVPEWALNWRLATGREIFISPMNIYNKEPQKAKELRASNSKITIAERSDIDETISFWEPDLLDMAANQRNHEYTAEYCMKHGCTLNLQIHLFASLP